MLPTKAVGTSLVVIYPFLLSTPPQSVIIKLLSLVAFVFMPLPLVNMSLLPFKQIASPDTKYGVKSSVISQSVASAK